MDRIFNEGNQMHYQINVFLNHDPSGDGSSEPDRQSQATSWEEAMTDVFETIESYLSAFPEEPSPLGRELVAG